MQRRGQRILILLAAAVFLFIVRISSADDQPEDIHVDGGDIHVDIQGTPPVPIEAITKWVTTAATAVANFDGKYPVAHVRIQVNCLDHGDGVDRGMEFGGKFIRIDLGRDLKPAVLAHSWMMTHEMFHLSFPDLDEKYHWMEEGMADYLEPIARARISDLTPEEVWHGYVQGMPKGQPKPGEGGLDQTPTWGRTYWGGCTFWLLADLQIREQTQNRKAVDDAFRAILDAGGDDSKSWPIEKVIEVGDHATGTSVLKTLHDQMGPHPVTVDLDGLWKKLGVVPKGDTVVFDDAAPLAAIRKSMTASSPATRPSQED